MAGVVTWLQGGLGNQMFMVAAGHIVSRIFGCPHYVPWHDPKRNPHSHRDYRETLLREFTDPNDIRMSDQEFARLIKVYREYHSRDLSDWNPQGHAPPVLLTKYYQYYPAIQPYETEIREKFLKGLAEFRETVRQRYPEQDWEKTAFLHIRRGDYTTKPHIHCIIGESYYQASWNRLRERDVRTVFVMSDDPASVRSWKLFQDPVFRWVDSNDELETLALMSLCQAGAICANSTFAWWGAFLGPHSTRAPVVVPHDWIRWPGVTLPIRDLFPAEWHIETSASE